jgi:secreted trypsin-like serine protease
VAPIALSSGRDDSTQVGTLTGWGQTSGSNPTLSDVLMKADLTLVDQAVCAPAMADIFVVLPSMICAGYPNGAKGGCYADSGGPLAREQLEQRSARRLACHQTTGLAYSLQ